MKGLTFRRPTTEKRIFKKFNSLIVIIVQLLTINLIKVRAEEDRKKELEKQIALKQQQKEAEKRKQELVISIYQLFV